MGHMEQVLAEFGQQIGLTALMPGPDGHVQLRLESGALLGASTQGREVVLHYAVPVEHGAAALTFKAMCKAGRIDTASDPVQIGLRATSAGEWLMVATRVPLDQFSAREVHRIGAYLRGWMEQVHA